MRKMRLNDEKPPMIDAFLTQSFRLTFCRRTGKLEICGDQFAESEPLHSLSKSQKDDIRTKMLSPGISKETLA